MHTLKDIECEIKIQALEERSQRSDKPLMQMSINGEKEHKCNMAVNHRFVSRDQLREEAKKWIEALEGDRLIDITCKACVDGKTRMIDGSKTSDGIPIIIQDDDVETLVEWIKHFFNLEEHENGK